MRVTTNRQPAWLVCKVAIDPDIKERYLHEFPKIDLLYYYFFNSLLTGV